MLIKSKNPRGEEKGTNQTCTIFAYDGLKVSIVTLWYFWIIDPLRNLTLGISFVFTTVHIILVHYC